MSKIPKKLNETHLCFMLISQTKILCPPPPPKNHPLPTPPYIPYITNPITKTKYSLYFPQTLMCILTKCTKLQSTQNVQFIKSVKFTNVTKQKATIIIKSTLYKNPIKSFPITPTTPL